MNLARSFSGTIDLNTQPGDLIHVKGQVYVVTARVEMKADGYGNVAMVMMRKPNGRKEFVGYLKANGTVYCI